MNPSPKRFRIAMSFPGARRRFVSQVAERLAEKLGRENILYDEWHEAEFARPRLATYLPQLYRNETDLVAVFLCADYQSKEWCGLEWDAIVDIIKQRQDAAVMLLRFDNTEIAGLFSTHGYVWIANRPPDDIARLIVDRLRLNSGQPTLQHANPPSPQLKVDATAEKKQADQTKRRKIAKIFAATAIAIMVLLWGLTRLGLTGVSPEVQPSPGVALPSEPDTLPPPQTPYAPSDPVLFTLNGHEGPVSFVFSSDSKFLISAGSVRSFRYDYSPLATGDETLRLWDAKRGNEIKRLSSGKLRITSVRIAPAGDSFAASVEDGTARIWTLPDGNESVIHREPEQEMTAIAYSPDSAFLAVGTDKGIIKIFDRKTKQQLVECVGHGGRIIRSGFFFSADGAQLFSAATDGSLRVWEVATGKQQATILDWDLDGIWAVLPTDDPNRVVALDAKFGKKRIKLVDLISRSVIKTSDELWVDAASMSADGKSLYTIGDFGFHAFDVNGLKESCADDAVRGTRFSLLPGAVTQVVVVNELRLVVYHFDNFALDKIRTEQEHASPITALSVSPDGESVATGDEAGIIKLWSAKVLSHLK